MSTQSELCLRFLKQFVVLTGIAATVFLSLCVATGTLGKIPLGAMFCTGLLMFGLATYANWRVADKLASGLAEVERVLREEEKGTHDFPLTAECHRILPDVAGRLEHAQQGIRDQLHKLTVDLDRLRNVINSMAEGVIAVDEEQRILVINSAACDLFSMKEATAAGRHVWEQVRQPPLQSWVAQALEGREPAGGEISTRTRNPRELSISVSKFKQTIGNGAVIVMTDVTDLRRLERVRQKFVANASHELKTPITSIQACVETLMDGAVDDLQCRDRFLQTICEQSTRLSVLVKDLLTLARLEAEPSTRETHPVSVEEVFRLCYNRHQHQAERKGLQLILGEVPANLHVLAEEEALEHILDNLLDNALKYTETGGSVTLCTRTENAKAFLEVKDTGIGIPQQHLPQIFERFYRVDRHRSREVGGTGLGLSIVKHLVQSIGGLITVTSKSNVGSTFTVEFKLASNSQIQV